MKRSALSRRAARFLALSALGLLSAAAACSSSGGQGAEGEACYPNNTCNDGFVCREGKCVRAGGTGGSGGNASTSTGTGTGGSGTTTGTGTGGSGGATSSGSTSTSSGTGGSTTANQPPVILAFGTNVTSLTEAQTVKLTAVVTDPDGIDDVIGGTLLAEPGGAIYGAFATTAQEGSYEISLSWDQIDQVGSIDFAQGATQIRTFKAQFFDQGGHTVEKTVDLTLTCNGKAACSGACVDTQTDTKNCGSCGHGCTGGNCASGKCPSLTGCLPKSNLTTCQSYCASQGMTCAGTCNNPYGGGATVGGLTFGNTTCTQYSGTTSCSASIVTVQGTRCCCAQ